MLIPHCIQDNHIPSASSLSEQGTSKDDPVEKIDQPEPATTETLHSSTPTATEGSELPEQSPAPQEDKNPKPKPEPKPEPKPKPIEPTSPSVTKHSEEPKLSAVRGPDDIMLPQMPGKFKTVGMVFYGRKSRVEILDCYLKVEDHSLPAVISIQAEQLHSVILSRTADCLMKSSSS